jgi:Domain of unknown function (DUF4272)
MPKAPSRPISVRITPGLASYPKIAESLVRPQRARGGENADRGSLSCACPVRGGERGLRATTGDRARVAATVRRRRHLSPCEEAFLAQDSPPDELIFAASWRTESLQVLTWALGMIDQLPPPSERANLSHIGLTPEILAAPDSFASSATLRSEDELEAARAEMTSHHWGVRAGPAGRRLFGHQRRSRPSTPALSSNDTTPSSGWSGQKARSGTTFAQTPDGVLRGRTRRST